MKPEVQGRYCESCATTVVNFEGMSDRQLMNYFSNFKGSKLCGRVAADQINRPIVASGNRHRLHRYWQYGLALFLLVTKSKTSAAQGGMTNKSVEQTKNFVVKRSDGATFLKPSGRGLVLVVDAEDNPIPGVSISQKNVSAVSDSFGYFSTKLLLPLDSIVLSCIGYQTKNITAKDIEAGMVRMIQKVENLEEVRIESSGVRRSATFYGGGLSIIRQSKMSLKDSINNFLASTNPSLKIYPNPAQRGKMIQVQFNADQRKFYLLRIYTSKGECLLTEQIGQQFKKGLVQIVVPASWSAGTYFLSLYNNSSRMKTEQLIVL